MLDEDVRKLFRVKAEFDWRVPWDEDGVRGYAAFLSSQVRSAGLRHFDAAAVARVVEHGARLAESREWLSTRFVEIAGLAAEASHWAAQDGSELVGAEHVERAIEQQDPALEPDRAAAARDGGRGHADARLRRRARRAGQRAVGARPRRLHVRPPGADHRHRRPRQGSADIIERETELSGHIHDKGFLTLSGYLRERYGGERRIALGATLTFEQSYEQIDGDSAASAELYALLSELAGVPLRQDIAVTGSVNQHGELQAIGGVNEKIEGFYRACTLRELTGRQGVIIPESNVRHLMLSREVVDSVRAGRFHVWSARDVDDGIELLTGIPARAAAARTAGSPRARCTRASRSACERWARMAEAESQRRPRLSASVSRDARRRAA